MLAISTTDLTTGLTPLQLAETLIGSGVSISNVKFIGSNSAAGKFSGGESDDLGVADGIILSSGIIAGAAGPNGSDSTTSAFDLPGDADLNGLIPGYATEDATILEFDFVATAGTISFSYVFGSEEYNEFVELGYNDVFGFFLDGQNIALVPGTTTPVSIETINNNVNTSLYFDNDFSEFSGLTPYGTEADGFTVVLKAVATVSPGTHHIKLAIADVQDPLYDSWVFLLANSFVSGDSDLQMTISDSPDPVVVGTPLTYDLIVTNQGPDPATSVNVQSVLPAGVTFVSATSSQGTVLMENGTVIANLGTLTNGASATVKVVVTPNELGALLATATVTAPQVDANLENNTATQSTTVEPARVSIDDVQIVEGNDGTREAIFTVSLNGPNPLATVSVAYSTIGVTALGGEDFLPRNGVLTFLPGMTQRTVAIPIVGDKSNELSETFVVQLTNGANVEILKGTGIGTILDNDPLPNFYVDDVQVTTTVAGARVAVFTVALDWPSGRDVSVAYATSDGGAQAGIAYQGMSGVLNFAPGERTKQVVVPITTSDVYSGNQKFYLNLSDPTNSHLFDPQGACTMVYAAEPVGEQTIDNGAPGYSRSFYGWETLTNTVAHQLDYDYHTPGDGSGTASWTFAALPAGSYEVLTRWIPFSNRATNAPFTILDGNTSLATVLVNQQLAPTGDQSNGITWQSLGRFEVVGNTLTVRLNDNANGLVVADAVRLVSGAVAPQVPEMDVSSLERSIDKGDDTPSFDDGTEFGTAALYTDSIPHTFTISNNANADLALTGSPRVTIGGAHAADFQVALQPSATVGPGKTSNFQIVFHPLAAGVRTAVVSIANSDDSEHPYTFTIQGTTAENSPGMVILDDTMPGFAKFGTWSSTTHAQAYLGEFQTTAAGSGSAAKWQFEGLTSGTYFVYTSWAASPEQGTNAPFTVSDGGVGGQTLYLNQQQAPGTFLAGRHWGSLGAITIATGMLTVDLTNAANGAVVADAVMIVRQGAEIPAAPLVHNAALPQDVNADGKVSVGDLLVIVNSLLRTAAPLAASSAVSTSQPYYMDVTNDGRVSSSDVLSVVNYLLRRGAAPSAAPQAAPAVAPPEAVDQALVLLDDSTESALEACTPSIAMPSTKVETPPFREAARLLPFDWELADLVGDDEDDEVLELLVT